MFQRAVHVLEYFFDMNFAGKYFVVSSLYAAAQISLRCSYLVSALTNGHVRVILGARIRVRTSFEGALFISSQYSL